MEYSSPNSKNILTTLRKIYKPRYIFFNALLAVFYYLFLMYLVRIQSGMLFLAVPNALIYALVITSSMLLTLAIYSVGNTRKNRAKTTASGLSAATIFVGSGLCGCGASFLILFAGAIGLNAVGVLALRSFLINYNIWIFSFLVVLNFIVIAFYLNRLSTPECAISDRSRKKSS